MFVRYVLEIILEIKEIFYIVSGKKVEVVVKWIFVGEYIKNRGVLVNLNFLDFYYGIVEFN